MCTSDLALYPLLGAVIGSLLGPLHAARLVAATDLVWALLAVQSLHPADLARGLPGLQTARASQAQRRVRRGLARPWLGSKHLTPLLIAAALRLMPAGEVIAVLDSTRCWRWEIFSIGVRWHGRVLPVAWEILAYPWPQNAFTPTVITLVDRLLAAWPAERAVHLVADRGFPSLKLFRCLERWSATRRVGSTIRLRASDWVRLSAGPPIRLGVLEQEVAFGTWRSVPASYHQRHHGGPISLLVIGKGIPLVPPHQRGEADRARCAARLARRHQHLASKGQGTAVLTDRVWALLSTRASWREAVQTYTQRFATEGTYRDLKSWDLARVATHETDPTHLDGLLGVACLAYLIQAALGAAAGRTSDGEARARQDQWSTTDRLSLFWRGRQVLHDRAHDWRPWLQDVLRTLAQHPDHPFAAPRESRRSPVGAKEAA